MPGGIPIPLEIWARGAPYHIYNGFTFVPSLIARPSHAEVMGYGLPERLQRAYNNNDGLMSASVTSMHQNSPMNADYYSRGPGLSQFYSCVVKPKTSKSSTHFITASSCLRFAGE